MCCQCMYTMRYLVQSEFASKFLSSSDLNRASGVPQAFPQKRPFDV
jgi:hypothetical protein